MGQMPPPQQLKHMFYNMHNTVNKRLRKPDFPSNKLNVYKIRRTDLVFSAFIRVFTKSYGPLAPGMGDTTYIRRRVATSIIDWMKPRWKLMFN